MPEGPTVANSSCLIVLEKTGMLDLLEKLYQAVHVPEAVAQELGSPFPAWVQVMPVQNRAQVQALSVELGKGEAEAIALGLELTAARLILDDKKARRIARQLKLPITGTLAILIRAKSAGLIPNVRDALAALVAVNFRVSDQLVEELLRQARE